MLTLQYETRDTKSRPEAMRKEGKIPAVFYGPKEKSTPICVRDIDFRKAWKEAGESSIVVLKNKAGEEHEALIQEVDIHPVTGIPRHADFYVIEKGKKLQVKVRLTFSGTSPAVKDLGGTLVKVLHELEIEAMPKDLPHNIIIDIAPLATLESQIVAKDIPLPSGVELITGPEEVIAAIAVAKEEPKEEAAPSIDDIEVVGQKGKEEPEGGETAEASEKPAGKPGTEEKK